MEICKVETIDSHIVIDLKNGNYNSFNMWLNNKKNKFYKIGWSYLYNEYDIQDALSQMKILVIEKIHQLKKQCSFESWVVSIFINECKKILRLNKRETKDVTLDNSYVESAFERIELKEQLNKIEEIYREVIILKYVSGYSQEEIAQILNIPVGTVKSRIYRGIHILKNNISKEVG